MRLLLKNNHIQFSEVHVNTTTLQKLCALLTLMLLQSWYKQSHSEYKLFTASILV